MNAKQCLIVIRMSSLVPRSAIGYVADLTNRKLTPRMQEDRLEQIGRYQPELARLYREAETGSDQ